MDTRSGSLDDHLDRFMASAYESLASKAGSSEVPSAPDPLPSCPEQIGPYPVSGVLGRGGTSLVLRGRDPELGRDLAIKIIDARFPADGDLARRFLDEARLCSQLPHPGIVPIYDVGRLDDGRPWFTMKLVEGQTLADLLEARREPDERREQHLEVFQRVCETVAFAHARGVVHGDLKPHNIMVAVYGQVHVMDWGFSRLGAAGETRNGRVPGTPAYMAPEQAGRSQPIDARTDVFGLGGILCVILTGAPPFLGGSRSEIEVRAAQGCLDDAMARLDACGADAALVQLGKDCLAADPARRPADADRVAARITAWFSSIEERTRQLEVAAARAAVKAQEQRRTRRRSIALAGLACASAAGYVWMRFEQQAKDYEARVALVQAGERAQSLTDLGNAMLLHGDADEALAALRRAHDTNPHDARALEALLELLRSRGAPDAALELARAAPARSPESAGCWRVLGEVLFDDGRIGEATAAFRRARGLQDNRANCDGLGGCLLELRQLDDAAACFRAALEHDPTNAVAHAHRGLVERLQGRFADAIASFERSRELASTAWAANCRGWIAETERLAAAERALPDPLAPGATTVRASVESAVAAYVTGRPLLAAAMFAAVFESDPPAAAGAFLGWNRDWAVRAALAAAAARSRDAEGLDDAGRAQWRALAADWLGRAIADCRASYDRGMAAPADVRRRIEQWRAMPGLEALVAQSPGNGREAAGKSGSLRDGLAELDARLRDGEPAAVVDAAFADICTLHRLGPVPGVLMPYGGMVFDRTDADVLILGGHAQRATGSLYSVALSRDGDGRVCGFRARARRFAKASFVDGGLVFGPDDLLLFTRWPTSEIGQLRRDSREPDRVQTLPVPSAGGLGIVPAGFPGAGRVKVLAWPGGEWFDARLDLLEDSVSIQAPAQSAALAGGPDGFAWLQPRPPHFARPAILVAEWSRHALATYDLDDRGDPIVATRRLVVSGIRGALGLAVDPRTGDILISTWRNDGTDEIAVLAFHR